MTTVKEMTEQINIALDDGTREELAEMLNTLLADEHTLYVKLRNYHWNVVGIEFVTLHELFEEQYNEIKERADLVAERVRKIGYPAIGTMKEFLDYTRIAEARSGHLSAEEMLDDLMNTNEAIIRNLRSDIDKSADKYHDEGTTDLLVATIRQHETMAWMLRSLLGR